MSDLLFPIVGENFFESFFDHATIVLLIKLLVVLAMVMSFWKMFEKAGHPGWGVLIPIYNFYLLCKIAGRSDWWFLMLFIPGVNIVVMFLIAMDITHKLKKDPVHGLAIFALGVILLGLVFYPILGHIVPTYLDQLTLLH